MRMNATNQTSDAGFRSLPWRLLLLLGLAAVSLVLASPSPAAAAGAVGSSPDAGSASSLVLDAAGNPVVSYVGSTAGDLKLLHCDDPDCTGGGESIEAVAPNAVLSTSLALDGSGNPVIAYNTITGPIDLVVTHCNDVNCSGGDESTVSIVSTGVISCCVSLALDASGNPVVAYHAKFPGFTVETRTARPATASNCPISGLQVCMPHWRWTPRATRSSATRVSSG